MLGPYRLEHEIGRGSMGAVWLGYDTVRGHAVAIKTMALARAFAVDDLEDARDRFFREAALAGRLQHPDIVEVFEAGESQGLAWIAMEHLPGHDLLRHAAPTTLLPEREVLQVVARVAEALGYAHTRGVVHRDVKPANVLVDRATSRVKVADFGISRIADACRTRTGIVLGTPAFMSPEQMSGGSIDGRSDLYALGVMLYQLLTGELPYRGLSMAGLMHAIVNEPAPDVRLRRPGLSAALAATVARALAKSPAARTASGASMAADLRELAEVLPSQR